MDRCRDIIERNLFDVGDGSNTPYDLSYLKRAADSVVTRFQGLMKQCGDDSNTAAKCKETKSKINEERSQICNKRPVYIVIPTKEKQFNNLEQETGLSRHCCCCHHFQACESHCPASSNEPSCVIKTKKDKNEHQKTQANCNSSKEEIQPQICHLCCSQLSPEVQPCDKYKIPFTNKEYCEETCNYENKLPFTEATQDLTSPPPPKICSCLCKLQQCHPVEEITKCKLPKPNPCYSKEHLSTLQPPKDKFRHFKITNDDFSATDVTTEDYNQCSSSDTELWSHYIPVLENLKAKQHSTTDVVVLIGPEEFFAHKVVLSAYSEYFRQRLLKSDRHCFDITAEGVTVEGFNLALKWMYSGQVETTEENIGHLWTVAKRLGIRRLCKLCKQQLRKMIRQHGKEIVGKLIGDQQGDDDDCAVVVLEDETKCREQKHSRGKTRASANVQLLLKCGDFVYWSPNQMIRFLSHNKLRVKSEKEVFDMAAAWLRHGWPERKSYVTQTMNCVRFSSMTRKELVEGFTHHCNKFLWTNRDVVTSVLVAYLENTAKANENAECSCKKQSTRILLKTIKVKGWNPPTMTL